MLAALSATGCRRLAAAVICILGVVNVAAAQTRVAQVRQGTNISLTLSPDGQWLVVDLLGGLWRMPATGGSASALLRAGSGARNPQYSADGQRIVYQRFSNNQWDLWLLDLDDGKQTPLTRTSYDEIDPIFGARDSQVIFASDRTGFYSLWSQTIDSGETRQLTIEAGDSFSPSISDRGEIAYIHLSDERWSLRLLGDGARGETLIDTSKVLSAPSWRPGSGALLYNEQSTPSQSILNLLLATGREDPIVKPLTRDEDVFASRAAWLSESEYLYAADGRIWRRRIASPNRDAVHLSAAVTMDSLAPARATTPLDSPGPHPVTGIGGSAQNSDGSARVFSALGDLWLERDGELRRLTDDVHVDMNPNFSPDGGRLVFASDRAGSMDIWQIDLANSERRQLSAEPEKAYRPAIDPSGRWLAYLVTDGFGNWSRAALQVRPLAADGPAAATLEDGLYDTGQLLWHGNAEDPRIAVQARIDGEPRADDWLGFDLAGNRVVVPSSVRLDSATEDPIVRPALNWEPVTPSERYAIQAGRLFDGIRNQYRRHVDIHIEGQRIAAIVERDRMSLPPTVIDARDATVIPGLIDTHVHQSSLLGKRLGRIWLVNGVTTVREVGGQTGEALERAESWSSGRRAGPRLVISPDGDTPAAFRSDLRDQPIVVDSRRHPSASLTHDVLHQWRFMSVANGQTPPWLGLIPVLDGPSPHWQLLISPLNESYQDVLSTAAASGVHLTTGLAALSGSKPESRIAQEEFERLFQEHESLHWLGERDSDGISLGPLQSTLLRVLRDGGRLAAGSDAPAVPYGYGLHSELRLLAESGIANDQILRIASIEGAAALGLASDLGTLESGKLADFVVLDGDPLRDISDTLKIVAIVKGGVWFDRSALLDTD